MKRIIYILLTTVLLGAGLSSCIKNICIQGDGLMTTEVRRTGTFNQLENTTAFDVIYKKADSVNVSITGEKNLLDYIRTETRDNILTIRTLPGTVCFDYTDRPVITVTGPNLRGAILTGSGNMIADEMSGEIVSIKLTGSGDLIAESVITGDLLVTLSGSGDLKIDDASCENSDLLTTGSGSIDLSGVCDSGELKITHHPGSSTHQPL